jgi:hypothetical protein
MIVESASASLQTTDSSQRGSRRHGKVVNGEDGLAGGHDGGRPPERSGESTFWNRTAGTTRRGGLRREKAAALSMATRRPALACLAVSCLHERRRRLERRIHDLTGASCKAAKKFRRENGHFHEEIFRSPACCLLSQRMTEQAPWLWTGDRDNQLV